MFIIISGRRSILVIDIILYALIIIASILLLISLSLYVEWLLVPPIFLMILDITRRLITVFFIFFFAHWNLVHTATAIFSLGLQFFHKGEKNERKKRSRRREKRKNYWFQYQIIMIMTFEILTMMHEQVIQPYRQIRPIHTNEKRSNLLLGSKKSSSL
uniref:Peptidase S54 rhomboid domain-containing protein n=1 Tax=Onchocerca volvulus TaxID=6282 RepID=A0A8R1TMZ1_ONCVO